MAEQPDTHPRRQHMTDEEVEERLTSRRLSRRRLLAVGATSSLAITAVLAASAACGELPSPPTAPPAASDHTGHRASPTPQTPGQTNLAGFAYFNPFQAAVVAAAAARIIPTDDTGLGATEAGVVYFIDRQLSADYGLSGRRYQQGPYQNGTSTQGDQSCLPMRDRYRLGIAGMEAYARQLYQQG